MPATHPICGRASGFGPREPSGSRGDAQPPDGRRGAARERVERLGRGAVILLEACVDSPAGAVVAADAGAGRVELCADLVEGGTTPSAGAIALAVARTQVPVMVMIRPRGGDFLYSGGELEEMRRDIAVAAERGAAGVVLGLLRANGSVDAERTALLVGEARPLSVTFHRAFDLCRDPFRELEALVELGVDRVLTSGQAPSVPEGLDRLRELAAAADGRIGILPGGGIRAENVADVVSIPGIHEVHVRAAGERRSPMTHRNPGVHMGSRYEPDEYRLVETDPDAIRALLEAAGAA